MKRGWDIPFFNLYYEKIKLHLTITYFILCFTQNGWKFWMPHSGRWIFKVTQGPINLFPHFPGGGFHGIYLAAANWLNFRSYPISHLTRGFFVTCFFIFWLKYPWLYATYYRYVHVKYLTTPLITVFFYFFHSQYEKMSA